jgi:hypothetical protein
LGCINIGDEERRVFWNPAFKKEGRIFYSINKGIFGVKIGREFL